MSKTNPAGAADHGRRDGSGVETLNNGTTTINGVNDAGDLVGFSVDSAGNTDGALATPNHS